MLRTPHCLNSPLTDGGKLAYTVYMCVLHECHNRTCPYHRCNSDKPCSRPLPQNFLLELCPKVPTHAWLLRDHHQPLTVQKRHKNSTPSPQRAMFHDSAIYIHKPVIINTLLYYFSAILGKPSEGE